ncbi:insulinase family protein [Pyxidicoccus trucidator]|uniref:insulinase family protein n=1 Tax=Pyxidicoccus trucidator TaxID=2709662 RepID=UPI0013DA5160|nr:insulinase family protein [Pyxidicoccus trucidator]
MRLVVREDPRAKQVTVYLSYRVGATDEPAGKTGLAELAARLSLMARHGGAGAQTLEARLEAADVTSRNTVTYDDTELWSTLAQARFARAVELEAQRMSEPLAHVTEEDFRRVRARQMDDLWARYEAQGTGPSRRWLHEKLLAGHPYGRPVGGTPESLEHLTLEDVQSFVKANYTPAHAVLVVSGPVPLADAKFEVARAFSGALGVGSDKRIPPVARIPPPAPEEAPGDSPMEVVRGSVKVPRLHFLLTVPGRYSGKHAEGMFAMEAIKSWMGANLKRDEYALGNSYTTTYQELDGLTVIDCAVDLMRHVREEEARGLATNMRGTLESFGERMLEGMSGREAGPSASFQAEQGGRVSYNHTTADQLRRQMDQELRTQSRLGSAVNIARTLRATGRVDILRFQEEQVNRALTYGVMSPYLRQYFRAERVRTMLVLP